MKPVIIGAGPIGSNTARLLKDLEPLIIEARPVVGKPVQCTGLVSTRLRKITGFPKELILNKIRGAVLYSRNEKSVINASRVMAHVIDRQGFDKWMHQECGAETHFNEKFIDYHQGRARTKKGVYNTSLLIDCSGPKNGLLGVQAVTELKHNQSLVELHFNKCPGFFAWVVPVNEKTCRVGLACNDQPMKRLKKFLKQLNAGKVREWNAGMIPMKVNDFIDDNIIRCGDAAGQVKALSGGGLVTGLLSSKVMSKAVLNAYETENFSKEFFRKKYYKPWNKKIGRELRIHQQLRRYLNNLTPKDYDKLLVFINKNKAIIEQYGDMDFLSKFLLKLLRPHNIPFLLKALWQFIAA